MGGADVHCLVQSTDKFGYLKFIYILVRCTFARCRPDLARPKKNNA